MEKLLAGVRKFHDHEQRQYTGLFRRLSRDGQDPHTLFITCADSRVIAELITQSQPGDLFVVKNIGNIVPPANVTGSTNSTAAAIEFAVSLLRVQDVVVCGHSQCGAIAALLHGLPPEVPETSSLHAWLALAAPVHAALQTRHSPLQSQAERTAAATEEKRPAGPENLRTYPSVQKRLRDGTLRLHGWIFHIATATVHAYDPASDRFLPLTFPQHTPPTGA